MLGEAIRVKRKERRSARAHLQVSGRGGSPAGRAQQTRVCAGGTRLPGGSLAALATAGGTAGSGRGGRSRESSTPGHWAASSGLGAGDPTGAAAVPAEPGRSPQPSLLGRPHPERRGRAEQGQAGRHSASGPGSRLRGTGFRRRASGLLRSWCLVSPDPLRGESQTVPTQWLHHSCHVVSSLLFLSVLRGPPPRPPPPTPQRRGWDWALTPDTATHLELSWCSAGSQCLEHPSRVGQGQGCVPRIRKRVLQLLRPEPRLCPWAEQSEGAALSLPEKV